MKCLESIIPNLKGMRLKLMFKFHNEIQHQCYDKIQRVLKLEDDKVYQLKKENNILYQQLKLNDKNQEILDKINDNKNNICELEKNANKKDYNVGPDVAFASNCIKYLEKCELINWKYVKEPAQETLNLIKKYLRDYSYFLKKDIEDRLLKIFSAEESVDLMELSNKLEMRLQELNLLKSYKDLYEIMNENGLIRALSFTFDNYQYRMTDELESLERSANNTDYIHKIHIAEALMCLDRFNKKYEFGKLSRAHKKQSMKAVDDIYMTVIYDISKFDFSKANIGLGSFQGKPLNKHHMMKIQHELELTIDNLRRETNNDAYIILRMIEEKVYHDLLSKLNYNLRILNELETFTEIWKLFRPKTQENISKSIDKINLIISNAFKKGIELAYAFIDANCFTEAEIQNESVNSLKVQLTAYLAPEDIMVKFENLQNDLDASVIINQQKFEDINNFIFNPPKVILNQFNRAKNPKFKMVHAILRQTIKETIVNEIAKIIKLPLNAAFDHIHYLKYALSSIPEDLQDVFTPQLDQLNFLLQQKQNDQKEDLVREAL